jgi:hypothetical protein
MNHSKRLSAALLLLAGGLVFSTITPASARGGGGSNIMMSPGYQRALQESRERYRESSTEQRVQRSTVHKRKKSRHH